MSRVLYTDDFATSNKSFVDTGQPNEEDVGVLCLEGRLKEALHVFERIIQSQNVNENPQMHNKNCFKNCVHLLQCCSSLGALTTGKQVHAHLIKSLLTPNLFMWNTLINMYTRSGSMECAGQIFDSMPVRNVFTWSIMLGGYNRYGNGKEPIKLLHEMQHVHAILDEVVFVNVLTACADTIALEEGKRVHAHVLEAGYELDVFVGSALVDMYAKTGSIEDARRLFENLPVRDVVSWGAMIAGYIQLGNGKEALYLFWQMESEEVKPDRVIFLNALTACASLAAMDQGQNIHGTIVHRGHVFDPVLIVALIDMYAKCGNIAHAHKLFDCLFPKNVVSWTSIISCYAQHGDGKEVLRLFKEMQLTEVKPDELTFTSILSACTHACLVDDGCHWFMSMGQDHGITALLHHFVAMINLLGRAGFLREAEEFAKMMPLEPTIEVWRSVIGACHIYGNMQLAENVINHVIKTNPPDAAAFVVLSNLYAVTSGWSSTTELRGDLRMKMEHGLL